MNPIKVDKLLKFGGIKIIDLSFETMIERSLVLPDTQKTDLDDVINILSRWYGVEVAIENYNEEKWVYSAEFKNAYLSNIL